MKNKKTRLIKILDDDAKLRCYARDYSVCQRCHGRNKGCYIIQPHHVVRRGVFSVRFDLQNLITLGKGCHVWQLYHPAEFIIWFEEHCRDRWEYIKVKRLEFFDKSVKHLEELVQKIKGGQHD